MLLLDFVLPNLTDVANLQIEVVSSLSEARNNLGY